MNRRTREFGSFETLEVKKLMTADLGFESAAASEPSSQVADVAPQEFGTADAPATQLKYKLDRCFIKSWSTSGDADDRPTEEVAFYYNKIAFGY